MDALLYGHNPDERIIAVHQAGDNVMDMYVRRDGRTVTQSAEFFPFFCLSDPSFLEGFSPKHWIKELQGNNYYRFLCAFSRWSDMWEAVRHVLERYNTTSSRKAGSVVDLPVLHLRPDPVSQFLIESGRTLFKGMKFEDLHRLQLDIETYFAPSRQLSRASKNEDRIIIIALSDNRGWEQVIDGRKRTETEMLLDLADIIQEKDPDVIEGHNILSFDIPYLLRRSKQAGVELKLGRDGSPLRSKDARTDFPQRNQNIPEIAGRHIIDTLILIQSYDLAKRNLESYGLKYAAKYFGLARPGRVYVPGDRIAWYWDNKPDTLIEYSLDDVREVAYLSELLSPSTFYLAQIVPLSYGTLGRVGSTAKIESLLVREYVRQRCSLPKAQAGAQRIGGYTDIFYRGILEPILYVDVESLYPSIITGETLAPRTDTLKTFPSLLQKLVEMRLDAKTKMNSTTNATEKSRFDALQSSYKILINSFYGYLGYSRGLFNDYEQADRVTTRGQQVLRSLIEEIRSRKGKVIEVDTDGIFFIPPEDLRSPRDEELLLAHISEGLPNTIRLHIDGRYRKMLSYKKKNYALLGYDGKIVIKGSSLVSRSIEPFGKAYIESCTQCLLDGNIERLHKLYVELYNDIVNHKIDIRDLARTETLRDSPEEYEREVQEGKRNRTASYEVALAAGIRWKPRSRISYYITGNDAEIVGFKNCKLVDQWDPNFPDENVLYYLKRLNEFSKKFEEFFLPQDFRIIFSVDGLFDFSPRGIGIITSQVPQEQTQYEPEEEERSPIDISIWLDVEEHQGRK